MEGSGKRLSQIMYLEGQKILQPFMNYHVLQTGKSFS